MPLVQWKDDYTIGLTRFDDHHKHLVDLLNQVHDNFIDGVSGSHAESILNEVIAYTQYHFKEEEHVMHSIGYPNLTKHMEEHSHFADRAHHLKKLFDSGIHSLDGEMVVFLKGWFSFHILKEDCVMAEYLYTYMQRKDLNPAD